MVKVCRPPSLPFYMPAVEQVHEVAMESHQVGLLVVALSTSAAVRWPRLTEEGGWRTAIFLCSTVALCWVSTFYFLQMTSICEWGVGLLSGHF